jgi:hypothetical protein
MVRQIRTPCTNNHPMIVHRQKDVDDQTPHETSPHPTPPGRCGNRPLRGVGGSWVTGWVPPTANPTGAVWEPTPTGAMDHGTLRATGTV